MKKNILSFILVFGFVLSALAGTARFIIVEKLLDDSYQVSAYINPNGSPTVTIYKTAEEVQKAVSVLSKDVSGLSSDSDRVIISFNQDGTINTLDARVASKNKDDSGESVIYKQVDPSVSSKITTLKTDVEAKGAEVKGEEAEAVVK